MQGKARIPLLTLAAAFAVILSSVELGATGSHGGPVLRIEPTRWVLDGDVEYHADFGRMPGNGAAYFYLSTSGGGTTSVLVEGQSVTLPIPNASLIGSPQRRKGSARLSYIIPNDPTLVGRILRVICVTVQNGVVHTTNLAVGGPILGDDIA